jgi:phosphate transport system protein
MVRINFHEELERAESGLLDEGALVGDQLRRVIAAVEQRDTSAAEEVIARDDRVDGLYLATDSRILNLLALQAPVAGDLRRVSAILHSNLHLERMGDLCVNIARSVQAAGHTPGDAPTLAQLGDMGQRARRLVRRSLDAFARRDVGLATELAGLDEPIDRLNRRLFRRLVELAAADSSLLDWAMRMVLVARYVERLADHAVDVGRQTVFLVAGGEGAAGEAPRT